MAAIEPWVPQLPPRVLAQLLWALVVLAITPPAELLHAALQQSGRTLQQANGRDCAQLVWGFARLRVAPYDGWWEAFFGRTIQVGGAWCFLGWLGGFEWCWQWMVAPIVCVCVVVLRTCWIGTLSIGGGLAAHGCMQARRNTWRLPAPAAVKPTPLCRRHASPAHTQLQLLPAMDAQQISTITQSIAVFRVKPSDAYLQQLLAAIGQLLPSFSWNGQLPPSSSPDGQLLPSLSPERQLPPSVSPEGQRTPTFTPDEQLPPSFSPNGLGMVAFGLALLGSCPPAAWRRAFASAAGAALGGCSAHNLMCIAMVLARWREDPGEGWWVAFLEACEGLMVRGGFNAQVSGLPGVIGMLHPLHPCSLMHHLTVCLVFHGSLALPDCTSMHQPYLFPIVLFSWDTTTPTYTQAHPSDSHIDVP